MKIKTSDLIGAELDLAVAEALNKSTPNCVSKDGNGNYYDWTPSKYWQQAGPIIEKEKIQITPPYQLGDKWAAIKHDYIFVKDKDAYQEGDTPLIAAMRCFVASKLGDEVEIPF